MIDLKDLKGRATGRWLELLSRTGVVSLESLDGKNHPCPKCGGLDRFRMIDESDGALFCNQCFKIGNGDGIAAVGWLTEKDFPDTIKWLAGELGINGEGPVAVDPVQAMAWQKGITVDSLVAYGAANDTRENIQVCRVPMHDANMQVVGHFDMAPIESLKKGKMTKDSKHGLFVAEPPKAGETVCLVEGVKDAAALHNIGISAVGLPTCRMAAEFARFFRDVHAVIVPDRDKAGISGAKETAARLYGVAESVKVAELPADYKEAGGDDVRDVLATRDGEKKVRDAIKNARVVEGLGRDNEVSIISMADAINGFIKKIGNEDSLLKTGLPYLDESIGGLARGEMVVIAGRPSHGKTLVGLQMLDKLSEEVAVMMISEEMAARLLAERMVAGITTVKPEEWEFHRDVVKRELQRHLQQRKPYLIAEMCGTVDRVMQAIERAKEEHDIGAVAVDYLQLLRGNEGSRYEQVSAASIALKQAAVHYDVVVLALCQLNRGIENRPTSSPKLSDLRDSGQIEQDADVMIFVEWLHKTAPEKYEKHEYKLSVGKNRNRGTKQHVIRCTFIPEKQRIYPNSHISTNSHAEFDGFSEEQSDIF